MKLTLLGTGCPEPSLRRASSGYLIEVAGQRLLFDIGGGVFDRLLQAGLMPQDIDTLFFSHLHSDHMLDYPRLVHAGWDAGKGLLGSKPLQVFGPAPIAEIHERFFGPQGAFAFDLAARIGMPGSQEVWLDRGGSLPRPLPSVEITEIDATFEHQGDGWALQTCAVPHADPFLTCLAFRITAEDKAVVYSGDAALCPQLEKMAQSADILIHWCYRLAEDTRYETVTRLSPSAGEIAEMAERAGVKHLILTHLRTHMDAGEDVHAAMINQAKAFFSGTVEIAEDLTAHTL